MDTELTPESFSEVLDELEARAFAAATDPLGNFEETPERKAFESLSTPKLILALTRYVRKLEAEVAGKATQ